MKRWTAISWWNNASREQREVLCIVLDWHLDMAKVAAMSKCFTAAQMRELRKVSLAQLDMIDAEHVSWLDSLSHD